MWETYPVSLNLMGLFERLRYTQHAEPGQRFTPDAFDGQVSNTVAMSIEGRPVEGGCTVVEAEGSASLKSVPCHPPL
ncbi:hypothetical protein [Streptomyces regalis]|uniref:Uncharacterized protein n=1 Tax=Streptomyces regalis TaxID=68262 RepID=A0A0X3VDU5_9ACTN|nr:hypothetical protein [Streptomyces regalis]KUL42784.1 hypothetical protein ADL12_09065 [Streptomyces regalis]